MKSEPDPILDVSVVMLTYNHARYVGQAIAGVLGQVTTHVVELIVVDDCSTDSTLAEVEVAIKGAAIDVRILSTAQNLGMHENHRRGIAAARGSYIAFCEGDDYWTEPAKLQVQVDLLRASPQNVGTHADFSNIREFDGSWLARPFFWRHEIHGSRQEGDLRYVLAGRNVIQTCTAMIQTDIAQSWATSPDLFDTSYPVGDWPLFFFASLRGKFAYIDSSFAAYRTAPGSAMNSGDARVVRDCLATISMLDSFRRAIAPSRPTGDGGMLAVRRGLVAAHAVNDRQAIRILTDWLKANAGHNDEWDPFMVFRILRLGGPPASCLFSLARSWRRSRQTRQRFTEPAPPPSGPN